MPAFIVVVCLWVVLRPRPSMHCCYQVLLAAWVLDAELDEVRVASFLAGLTAEMNRV